ALRHKRPDPQRASRHHYVGPGLCESTGRHGWTGRLCEMAMKAPLLRRCWSHSLACGMFSQELATACFMKADEAYTAGLLHAIGRLGLLAAYPVEYANVLNVAVEYSFDVLHCERELFDIDHCEAGA